MFKYVPYNGYKEANRITRLLIPESVQALDGYGQGVDNTHYNYIEWEPNKSKSYFVRKTKAFTFNGTEIWRSLEINDVFVRYASDAIDAVAPNSAAGLCDRFERVSTVEYPGQFRIGGGASRLSFGVDPTTYPTVGDWKAQLAEWADAGDPLTIEAELNEPEITDITDLITSDNLIKTEPHGTITAVNEYQYPVPTSIAYQLKQTITTEEEPA